MGEHESSERTGASATGGVKPAMEVAAAGNIFHRRSQRSRREGAGERENRISNGEFRMAHECGSSLPLDFARLAARGGPQRAAGM